MLNRLTRALFSGQRAPSEGELARARMLADAAIIGFSGAASAGVLLLLLGLPEQALVSAGSALCCALGLVVMRLSRSVTLSTHLIIASLLLVMGAGGLVLKQLSLLGFLGILPIGVLFLLDLRSALLWLVPAHGAVVVGGYRLLSDPLLSAPAPAVTLINVELFLLTSFGLTVAFAVARQRSDRSLLAARDEATRANTLKSQFLASFSHEIRTPLNGVLGTADALLAGALTPEVREQLLIIHRSGSSLLRTINDVLELSRVETGHVELFPVPTSLPELLKEVSDLFRARAEAKGVRLKLVLEAGHPVWVKVDELRLRQVLQNLVGNAVKFTASGEVRVRLGAAAASGGLVGVRIAVEDTGPGIPPEAQGRLFGIFTQARPRTDRAEGSGLGLAISKQFIDLMEGQLTVHSEVGRGSTFTVALTLPLVEQPALVPTAAHPQAEPSSACLSVLVVDDNEINLKVATTLVERLGHVTLVARDGAQALAAIAAHQPDVVLMDCHMPVLDGLEATRRLRATGDGRPVVAVTASSSQEAQEQCLAAGMNHFVSKPVSLASLAAALVEVSGRREPSPAAGAGPLQGKRVLVIDDDPHIRRMTARVLRAEGYAVSEARDTEEACALLEADEPSHVVVDRALEQGDDGLKLAERLCRTRAELHLVLTSGRIDEDARVGALARRGARFLPKPYGRRALLAALEAAAAP